MNSKELLLSHAKNAESAKIWYQTTHAGAKGAQLKRAKYAEVEPNA